MTGPHVVRGKVDVHRCMGVKLALVDLDVVELVPGENLVLFVILKPECTTTKMCFKIFDKILLSASETKNKDEKELP